MMDKSIWPGPIWKDLLGEGRQELMAEDYHLSLSKAGCAQPEWAAGRVTQGSLRPQGKSV
jgi:hypothetical protein